jgi:hypothetical protein
MSLRGEKRDRYLVSWCRAHEITTPEDPYPVWSDVGGPVVIAPMFTLYDYSFGLNWQRARGSLWRAHMTRASSAPTSSCFTPIRIPRGSAGATSD